MNGSDASADTMIDTAFVDELREAGGAELLGLLIDSAETEAVQHLSAFRAAHRGSDLHGSEQALHALKGAGSAVGLIQFAARAELGLNALRAEQPLGEKEIEELESLWMESTAAFRDLHDQG